MYKISGLMYILCKNLEFCESNIEQEISLLNSRCIPLRGLLAKHKGTHVLYTVYLNKICNINNLENLL